jgi:hypothetical protein
MENYANDDRSAEESADSHESYSLLAGAFFVSCVLWIVMGLAIWRAFEL